MLVTVKDYKTSLTGREVTIDTGKIQSIYNGYGVFDGRSNAGWCVVLKEKNGMENTTLYVSNDDVKLLRTGN